MMRNGHDGKLFVSALAPFAFLALLRGIRHGKVSAFGWYALIIGLCMLSPHYQMTYYLLVASGLFTLWLTFWDKERERPKAPVADMGARLARRGPRRRHRDDPGAAVPQVHPLLAARRGRDVERLGVRHLVRDAGRGVDDHHPAAVQRDDGELLGRQLLQEPHRVRRRDRGDARHPRPRGGEASRLAARLRDDRRRSSCWWPLAGTRRSIASGMR